jgi:hypothetical protein
VATLHSCQVECLENLAKSLGVGRIVNVGWVRGECEDEKAVRGRDPRPLRMFDPCAPELLDLAL